MSITAVVMCMVLCTVSVRAEAQSDTLVLVSKGNPDTLSIVQVAEDKTMHSQYPVDLMGMQTISIQLRDDSPEDGEGGATLFASELVLRRRDGIEQSTMRELGDQPALTFLPTVYGGFRAQGRIRADGSEIVAVVYDFSSSNYVASNGPDVAEIKQVDLLVLVANDYRINVLVDEQVVASVGAMGNIKDSSNMAIIRIELISGAEVASIISPTSWAILKSR